MTVLTFKGFGGVELAAEAWGAEEDPAVLLLHGGGQSRHSWRAAAEILAAAGRYVLAFDARGHGDSAWPTDGRYDLEAEIGDVKAILAQMSSRPVVIGATRGAMIALAALGEAGPALASGLVIVDASPWLDPDEAKRVSALLGANTGGFGTVEEAVAASLALAPGREPPKDLNLVRARLRQDDAGRYHWKWDPRFLSGLGSDAAAQLEAAAAGIAVPTLVIRGADSRFVSAEKAQRLTKIIPGAEYLEIEGAAHLATGDQAEVFNAALVEFLERRLPRDPIAYQAGSDARTLRDALGCFGTGVTIVTGLDDAGEPIGLTANSFSSVSLDPPLILFCLAKSSGNLTHFQTAKNFAINVLHIGQQLASNTFARPGTDRFSAVSWETWDTGVPILSGSLASFECDSDQVIDAGDHLVLIGRVTRARFEPRRDPLLYFRGKYRRLHFA